MPRGSRMVGARAAVLVGIVVVLVAATAGTVSAQQAGNTTTVNSCRTIDSSGQYALTGTVTGDLDDPNAACIEITAGNVTLDGQGHTVAGTGAGHGVEIDGSRGPVTNVTVENLQAHNWSIGVFALETDNGTIRRTITENSTEGIALGASSNYTLANNTATGSAIAIALGGQSQNNTLRRMTAVENRWGIHFERESANNTVVNSVARNNSRWDYYSERNDNENIVRNLDLATGTFSFSERNVALGAVTSPPPLPRGAGNLDSYVEATGTRGGQAAISLTMSYGNARNPVALWRHDGQHWSRVADSQTNGAASTVSANISEFGSFAALSDAGANAGGPVTVSADQGPAVQRNLSTPTATATPTATPAPTPTTIPGSAATEQAPSANATPTAARGESEATESSGIGIVRTVFVIAGVIGLIVLGIVALRGRNDRGPGFNR
ncbi:right-handed parallel beta-helix repeat-containing protein [Halococcus dombrowskii]|uniref:Right-handed parallel beta-helix repeat-containing protein n=2 Tax=Halococcus dombrowskii TaxID=179637 RepID=A0AAX3AJT7_HALDO|nr:right-handed parallel beta-helix repeat-containing protein [Halococcus dombrowskii]UOO93940.1 right-handed parallel beta-helix repeat-containing protein [Halococcus dombrowskii]